MISTRIARASAAFLLLGGVALLFAPDVLLPRLVPAFPPAGAWLGQLLGAGWLALAALDWLTRSTLLGGIYGRPVVVANAAHYFVAATVLLKVVAGRGAPPALWLVAVPVAAFAGIYGWLLWRGPFERDVAVRRDPAGGAR